MSGIVASSNGGEGAVEVGLDGADWQTGDGSDLRQLELLHEAEEKNASLTVGELGYALPDQRHLFAGDETGLEGTVAVRNVGRDV